MNVCSPIWQVIYILYSYIYIYITVIYLWSENSVVCQPIYMGNINIVTQIWWHFSAGNPFCSKYLKPLLISGYLWTFLYCGFQLHYVILSRIPLIFLFAFELFTHEIAIPIRKGLIMCWLDFISLIMFDLLFQNLKSFETCLLISFTWQMQSKENFSSGRSGILC